MEIETNEQVRLHEGAFVKIVVSNSDIPEDQLKHLSEVKSFPIGKDVELYFKLKGYKYVVRVEGDLTFEFRGNKLPVVYRSPCEIVERFDLDRKKIDVEFKKMKAKSLNEAFRKVSKIYDKDSSHSCNVYETFMLKESGELLNTLRGE